MQPPEEKLWDRTPGWESDSSSESEDDSDEEHEEKEVIKRAAEGLEEVAGILDDRWLDVPFIDFMPVDNEGASQSQQPRPLPPSKWGVTGPPPCFRIEHVRAPIVKETLGANGLQQTRGNEWVVMWSGPRMREKAYHGLHELQRVNHFPGSTELTRKDRLCVHFNKMARRYGTDSFDFVPETYVLPRQIDEFLEKYENSNNIWIVKPHASSQGKGIFLLRDLDQLPIEEVSVVSRYVSNPLLIQGLKFDLRVYVLVTSFEPLRAYVYREGLTRFASKPYSTEDEHLEDHYRHLTNYSINKYAKNFVENQEVNADNVGHKWSFSALNKHLKFVGIDSEIMWSRIMDLILKTLMSVRPCVSAETKRFTAHAGNCFELYGFDVLVDADLKPWLLEVNLSPSMLADSPLDRQVKSAVLRETFNLVGVCHPSWKALATARLRSQLAQARNAEVNGVLSPRRGAGIGPNRMTNQGLPANSMFNRLASAGCLPVAAEDSAEATEAVTSPSSSETPNAKLKMPGLAELCERDLKALAHALKEFGRKEELDKCPNFIRLYPTRTTTEKYAPLMRGQILSSILYKMLYDATSEEEEQPDTAEPPSPTPEYGRVALRGSETYGASRTSNQASHEEGPEELGEDRPATAASSSEEDLQELLSSCGTAAALALDEERAAIAVHTLRSLGTKGSSRLALLEYLVRLTNLCDKLRQTSSVTEKVEVRLEPCREQLMTFRRHLTVFLRTGASKSLPPSTGDVLEELASTCRAVALCISGELKAGVSMGLYSSGSQGTRGRLALEDMLPSGFLKSSRGERSVHTLQGLSSADLEFVLRSPECAPDFLPMLGAEPSEESDTYPTADMLLSEEENPAVSSGPLSALLRVLTPSRPSPRQLPPPAPKATLDVMQRTAPVSPVPQASHQQAGFLPSLTGALPASTHRQAGRQGPAYRHRSPSPMPSIEKLLKLKTSRSLPALPGALPLRSQPPPLLRQLLGAPAPLRKRRRLPGVAGRGGDEIDVPSTIIGLSSKLAATGLKPLRQPNKMTEDLLQGDIEF